MFNSSLELPEGILPGLLLRKWGTYLGFKHQNIELFNMISGKCRWLVMKQRVKLPGYSGLIMN